MFSTKAEYGVRVMAHLAKHDGVRPISLATIADAEGLPLAYLEHLVQRLRKAGLVESRRGAHGGYTLARPATDITMAEVVKALEGEIAPIECITADPVREGELGHDPCPTKLLWTRVQGSIVRTLNDMTLADLTLPPRTGGPAKPGLSREAGRRSTRSERGAGSPAEVTTHDPRDPEPARPHGGARDPPRRRPRREAGRDPRAHGTERLGQVDARKHADGEPQLRGDRGPHPPERRGRDRG